MDTSVPDQFIRVEKGSPNAEELAALTTVVVALAAARAGQSSDTARGERHTAGWRRPERQFGFRGPRTWRENPPVTEDH